VRPSGIMGFHEFAQPLKCGPGTSLAFPIQLQFVQEPQNCVRIRAHDGGI
jgi:hypothetical protein